MLWKTRNSNSYEIREWMRENPVSKLPFSSFVRVRIPSFVQLAPCGIFEPKMSVKSIQILKTVRRLDWKYIEIAHLMPEMSSLLMLLLNKMHVWHGVYEERSKKKRNISPLHNNKQFWFMWNLCLANNCTAPENSTTRNENFLKRKWWTKARQFYGLHLFTIRRISGLMRWVSGFWCHIELLTDYKSEIL